MHLKSLTLRGFKSFASATTLRFEPGITTVVGPNGSGKSNVVDAIAWVLGEQGAKALRGGKMEDVIFAGTAGRPPLGRAEVTLTIDNSDGALPIDYTEVSITRRMFREGSSEYEINGDSARLLDIQELLSDSGIGREMHVIVGQGQLDTVLNARPEDRRGFIEEAAGVLKHRKRKEKALRKLEAMQANLTRVGDLTEELRRQLKPLGKQAEIARRAAGIQAELRDSRMRLLADDIVALREELAEDSADEEAMRAKRAELEQAVADAREREAELERTTAADAPLVAAAQDTWYRLSALQERFRGTASLAAERARHLAAEPEAPPPGRDPEAMEAEAAEVRVEEQQLQDELVRARSALAEAGRSREELEVRLADAERALVAAARAVADRREGLAKLSGRVDALHNRAATAAEELTRLGTAATQARERAEQAEAELARAQDEAGELDQGELGLDERHESAVGEHESAQARVHELTQQATQAEREHSTWAARAEALAMGLTRKDGAGALLAAGSRLSGVLGSVAELLSVEPGHEAALATALGSVAEAVAVASPADAAAALALLKSEDAGRAGLLVGGTGTVADRSAWPALPDGATWAVDVVRAPDELRAAVGELLDQVAVVPDLDTAASLLRRHPGVRAVTRDGDLLGANWSVGGSSSAPSLLEVQAAVDEATQKAEAAAQRHQQTRAQLEQAEAHEQERRAAVSAALDALHESDARLSAAAESLAELSQRARAARAEVDRIEAARSDGEATRDRALAELEELEQRLHAARSEAGEEPDEPDSTERDGLREQLAAARQAEMDARLAVGTGQERLRAVSARVANLLRAAEQERAARERQRLARDARVRGARVAAAVRDAAQRALERIEESVTGALAERDRAQQARATREQELLAVRGQARDLSEQLTALTDEVHRDEMQRAQQRLRVEALEQRAVEEFGTDADTLAADYGPQQPAPPSAAEMAEYEQAKERGEQVVAPQPGPYHRPTQEKRAARAERDLALLGKVNPLALEEFAALEERHQFLATQLEDLKATRRDLLTVVKEVDERILEVFSAAYDDVAREFGVVFDALFPGGEGRLVLTDPEDMLLTGIDIEARPPGKKVKRLSLLSGGERSLVAVALLVAIFRARPSPFYVMDEIEAALDDTNLGRLLELVEALRASSQIILITHHKRTMEVADALYGVTMRGDGVTEVISQRLREPA